MCVDKMPIRYIYNIYQSVLEEKKIRLRTLRFITPLIYARPIKLLLAEKYCG